MDDLGQHFLVLEKEYMDIMEERRLADEAKTKQKRELEIKTFAATTMQAHWRGFRVRKQLKKKDKKKGQKGKKKEL